MEGPSRGRSKNTLGKKGGKVSMGGHQPVELARLRTLGIKKRKAKGVGVQTPAGTL